MNFCPGLVVDEAVEDRLFGTGELLEGHRFRMNGSVVTADLQRQHIPQARIYDINLHSGPIDYSFEPTVVDAGYSIAVGVGDLIDELPPTPHDNYPTHKISPQLRDEYARIMNIAINGIILTNIQQMRLIELSNRSQNDSDLARSRLYQGIMFARPAVAEAIVMSALSVDTKLQLGLIAVQTAILTAKLGENMLISSKAFGPKPIPPLSERQRRRQQRLWNIPDYLSIQPT